MNSRYLTKDLFYLALQKGYHYSERSLEILKSDLDYINMAIDNVKHRNQMYEIVEDVYWNKFNSSELKIIIKKIIDKAIQENYLTSTLFNIPSEYYKNFYDLIEFGLNDFQKLFMSYTNEIYIGNMHTCLVLISKYYNSKEKNEKLNEYYLLFVTKLTEVLINHFKCDRGIIEKYIEMIINGISNPLNFIYIKDLNDLLYVIENGDIKPEKNNPKYKKLTKKQD